MARRIKPEGTPTRGKTASNRLRRVDNFLLMYEPFLLSRKDGPFAGALFVDLGYGFDARTTLESARRFRRVNPALPILGVEIDPERVEAARPFEDEKTFFRLGGFNLPLKQGERVRLIRAFNVLRQYEEKDVWPAYTRLGDYVPEGGMMIEGTSTPYGQLWAANLMRKGRNGWEYEALVFSTNFRQGFDVGEFQTVLPKSLIHHVIPGDPVFEFFEAWKQAAAATSSAKVFGLRQWFAAAARELRYSTNNRIELGAKWLKQGWLIHYFD